MAPAAVSLSPGGQLDSSAVHLIRGRKTHFKGGNTFCERTALIADWTPVSHGRDKCVDTNHLVDKKNLMTAAFIMHKLTLIVGFICLKKGHVL